MSQSYIKLNINGFNVNALYFTEDVEQLFLPLIKSLSHMQKAKGCRLVVYLAAPPGAGKSTLSAFLSHLSETNKDISKIQSIGIDGFHYPQKYIESHTVFRDGKVIPMKQVKGSPETYDLHRLTNSIRALQDNDTKWPIYDRNLHDVVQDAILVNGDIVLIEGNWLLLDEVGWRELSTLCDYSIFISADEDMLKERLIQRKIFGGMSPEDAAVFYAQSDGVNVVQSLTNRLPCDYELMLTTDGKYEKVK